MKVRQRKTCSRNRIKSFNSRTREGATLQQAILYTSKKGFNSRTREGATAFTTHLFSSSSVSIHAPVKVRRRLLYIRELEQGFNSRTREGATFESIVISKSIACFNSRTREGATLQL